MDITKTLLLLGDFWTETMGIKKQPLNIYGFEYFDDCKLLRMSLMNENAQRLYTLCDISIFDKRIAKKVWGEKQEQIGMKIDRNKPEFKWVNIRVWKHELQQMILEENPLEFLLDAIKENFSKKK